MAETKMQLEDWLDDLCVRFIIHLPKEDLSSVARICFQVEEAQWFYEDFIRPLDPALPSMTLRSFCLRIFKHCPLLAPFSAENHMRAFEEFMLYKTRVPVRGAILLNEDMDSTVLVKGWKKGASWSFPRGKINKDEDDLDCAIREVYEETGFDIKEAGLVPKDDEVKYIQISMREQQIRLYVFRNIPMDTVFEPKTRKEISKVEWYKLSELPAFRKKGNHAQDDGAAAAASNANKFYMVAPFLVPLKKWVVQQKKKDESPAVHHLAVQPTVEEPLTEEELGGQAEPVAAPSNNLAGIETLEGATRELQRLLKVQPPTQGVQTTETPATTNPTTSAAGKGEALMALLQKSAGIPLSQSSRPPQQPSTYLHTPSDSAYPSASELHASQQYYTAQRQPVESYQNAPASGYYGHGQDVMGNAQPAPQHYDRNPFVNPAQQQRHEPVLLHPQPLPPQVQQSVLTRGILPTPALLDAAHQAGLAGQAGHYAQQRGGLQEQQQQQQQQPQQQQQLRHGNPYGQQGVQYSHQVHSNQSHARGNDAHAPQQQQAAKTAQLTGHAMSLLSAFKGNNGPRESGEQHKSRGITPQETNSALGSTNQSPYQPGPWSNAPTSQAAHVAAHYLPQHAGAPAAPVKTSPRAAQPSEPYHPAPKHTQPTENHRTVLLDMFRKAGPRSPLSHEIKLPSTKSQHSPGYARKDEPSSPSYKATSTAEPTADQGGSPLRAHPEPSLSYRPVQILSRPKQGAADQAGKVQDYTGAQEQLRRLQHRFSPLGSSRQDARNAPRQGVPSPRDRSFYQQMEQQEPKRSPQLNYVAAQAASLPYAPQPTSSAQSVPSYQQHQQQPYQQQHHPQHQQHPQQQAPQRKDSNSEQKQLLLSLFSKEQQQQQQQHQQKHHQQTSSPTTYASTDNRDANRAGSSNSTASRAKGKAREPPIGTVYDQARSQSGSAPRSRVASFASLGGAAEGTGSGAAATGGGGGGGGGGGSGVGSAGPPIAGSAATSRRGSQTPISPADRSFLFSYLESVTNTGR
ncbi:hypothetical protein B0J18DRAFT_409922 [Chaetomium sp. MPI-SDFR-AT-0129]|nr:hypothetical protein B0J18DRAFT_409922 [Chaetomium sp. MPI-SDFR-AT-0129]